MSPDFFFGDPEWTDGRPNTVKVPVALPCAECDERITEQDSGIILQQTEIDPLEARDRVVGEEGSFKLVSMPAERVNLFSVAIHIECFIRITIGSLGHQMKACPCYGGTLEDPPELTPHQAAKAAYTYFLAKQLPHAKGSEAAWITKQLVKGSRLGKQLLAVANERKSN